MTWLFTSIMAWLARFAPTTFEMGVRFSPVPLPLADAVEDLLFHSAIEEPESEDFRLFKAERAWNQLALKEAYGFCGMESADYLF